MALIEDKKDINDVVDIDPFKNDGKPYTKDEGHNCTLKLVGDTSCLKGVKSNGKMYTSYNDIKCVPGEKIYFYNEKPAATIYYTTIQGSYKNRSPYGSDVGGYIIVPDDASGKATLVVDFSDNSFANDQYNYVSMNFKFDFHSPKTTGWIRNEKCYPYMLRNKSRNA